MWGRSRFWNSFVVAMRKICGIEGDGMGILYRAGWDIIDCSVIGTKVGDWSCGIFTLCVCC